MEWKYMIPQSCVTILITTIGLNRLLNRNDVPFFDFYRQHAL
jgi:hypothetical protein